MSKRKHDDEEEEGEEAAVKQPREKKQKTGPKRTLIQLGQNCIGAIFRFLKPWELLSLAGAVRRHNKDLHNMLPYIQSLGIISLAVQKELEMYDDARRKGIAEIIWESKSIIAGGFIARCLSWNYGNWGEYFDIDIYVQTAADGIIPSSSPLTKLLDSQEKKGPRVLEPGHGQYMTGTLAPSILEVYDNPGIPRIQIMATTVDPVALVNEFDLDCCKVYFNGRKVTILNSDVFVGNRVVPEPATPSTLYFKFKLLTRIRKYKSRGFTIPWRCKTEDDRLIVGDQCLFNALPRNGPREFWNTFVVERRRAVTTCKCLPCTKGNRRWWNENEPDVYDEDGTPYDANYSSKIDYLRQGL